MIRIILLLCILVCAADHELIKSYKLEEQVTNCDNTQNLWIFEIEGCEYIGPASFSEIQFLVHKGNCKYCQIRLVHTLDSLLNSRTIPTQQPIYNRYGH